MVPKVLVQIFYGVNQRVIIVMLHVISITTYHTFRFD